MQCSNNCSWLKCTLCHGLCLISKLSNTGVCLRKTPISSAGFFSWFQLKSKYFSLFNPLMPSSVMTWLWLASKYSRLGYKAVFKGDGKFIFFVMNKHSFHIFYFPFFLLTLLSAILHFSFLPNVSFNPSLLWFLSTFPAISAIGIKEEYCLHIMCFRVW